MNFKQFGYILGLAIGIIASNTPIANALDFNFSFSSDNTSGGVGTVTGIIKGLQDNTNASQIPTEIDLTSYPTNVLGTNPNASGNVVFLAGTNPPGKDWGTNNSVSFQVTGGNITSAFFSEQGAAGSNSSKSYFILNSPAGFNGLSFNNGNGTSNSISNQGGFNGITFTSAAVPFEFSPSQGILLGIPLFIGLRILKRKRVLRKAFPTQLYH